MGVSRRTVLRGLVAGAAGLLLPPTLQENAEAARKYWALDRTHLGLGERVRTTVIDEAAFVLPNDVAMDAFVRWVEAYESRDTAFIYEFIQTPYGESAIFDDLIAQGRTITIRLTQPPPAEYVTLPYHPLHPPPDARERQEAPG